MFPLEDLHFIKGLDPVADFMSGTVRSDVVNCKDFSKLVFVIYKGVGTTGTSTITVEGCDDVTPSTTAAVPFNYRAITSGDTHGTLTKATTAGFTTTAGSSQLYVIELDVQELGDLGYQYASLKAVESVDAAVLGSILIFGVKKKSNLTTAIT